MTAQGLRIPFYLEYELRARHPQGVIARLDPCESYYWSPEHKDDQPPYPVTLFVVDTEGVEDTYVRTAALRSRLPNVAGTRWRVNRPTAGAAQIDPVAPSARTFPSDARASPPSASKLVTRIESVQADTAGLRAKAILAQKERLAELREIRKMRRFEGPDSQAVDSPTGTTVTSQNPAINPLLARIHRRTPMDGVRKAEGG